MGVCNISGMPYCDKFKYVSFKRVISTTLTKSRILKKVKLIWPPGIYYVRVALSTHIF